MNIYNKYYNKTLEQSWKKSFLHSWYEVGVPHTVLPLAQDKGFIDT